MTRYTHERINQLNPTADTNQNVLKTLHDTIYQWTESIPNGGFKIDISEALVITYNNYQRQLSAEKERRAKEREAESLNSHLAADDYDYDDDLYDDEDDDYDSDDSEDADYDDDDYDD